MNCKEHLGPSTILSVYWTNSSIISTFNHYDSGLLDVRRRSFQATNRIHGITAH